jgi:GAF domain-containing protein
MCIRTVLDEATPSELDTLQTLTTLLLSTDDLEEALRRIADSMSQGLPGRPMAGVTIRRDGQPVTVASSDANASRLDELEYSNDRGPCLDSLDNGRPVLVRDVTTERRWGRYPTEILAHGVRSIYSQPLTANGAPIGALNLYSTTVDGFSEETRRTVQFTAGHIGLLLNAALKSAHQVQLNQQLRDALESRTVIDQAIGIVMAQQRCAADDAFAILRSASQNRNKKLAEIALEIVTAVGGSSPARSHFQDMAENKAADVPRTS